ncbi:MAG: hypothetical protein H7A05_08050 [Pseudomonadales bacterium]|nr:hypothetical protein [Pseudomonadales bacterium]MCB1669387.1 hypothetical protein [Pseudomonadales bacterium]MCP5344558.1 hypothetical protein [Pseudomonadales bacterium]
MSSEAASNFLAYWGAGLSTLLAAVKLFEAWKNRFRIDVSYNFAGDMNVGNKIYIRNLSSHPIIIEYWEILYCSGRWPRRKFDAIAYPDHDINDQRIEAHSTCTLHFSEENYFPWGHKALQGRRIFIRLHIAGKKSLLKKVYP